MKQKEMKETKSCVVFLFEKVNKIDNPPTGLSRGKKKTQNTNIRNERGGIPQNCTDMKRIVRDHCEKLYSNKFNNPDELDKFLDTKYQN